MVAQRFWHRVKPYHETLDSRSRVMLRVLLTPAARARFAASDGRFMLSAQNTLSVRQSAATVW